MAAMRQASAVGHLQLVLGAALMLHLSGSLMVVSANPPGNPPAWAPQGWQQAHATFYGGSDNSGTMGGACGYGNLYAQGYGVNSAALSTPLFNDGLTCGACFQLTCRLSESRWCYPGKSIRVTATNLCPPGSFGGWCDPPKLHFDLSHAMFTTLAQEVGGVIPVNYMRVPCVKEGGVRFTIAGNPWWFLVLVTNVASEGDIVALAVQGNDGVWINLCHNWGANWSLAGHGELFGKTLGFLVTNAEGRQLTFYNVAPSSWTLGQTYNADHNF